MPSLNGITTQEEELRGCHVTTLDVQTEDAAASLGKAVGSYITIDTAALSDEHEQIECAGECLAEILVRVLGPHFHGKLCVCGLGEPRASCGFARAGSYKQTAAQLNSACPGI